MTPIAFIASVQEKEIKYSVIHVKFGLEIDFILGICIFMSRQYTI